MNRLSGSVFQPGEFVCSEPVAGLSVRRTMAMSVRGRPLVAVRTCKKFIDYGAHTCIDPATLCPVPPHL